MLPPPVANIDNGWTWDEYLDQPAPYFAYCSDQPVEEARAFVNELPHLGGSFADADTTMTTEYQIADTRAAGGTAHIVFQPVII